MRLRRLLSSPMVGVRWTPPESRNRTDGLHRSPEIGPEESRPRGDLPAQAGEGSLYCVCPRDAHFHSLAMARRQRVFRHECGATHAPRRVNDCQFALGFESANLRKNRPDASGRYACSLTKCGRSTISRVAEEVGQEGSGLGNRPIKDVRDDSRFCSIARKASNRLIPNDPS